MGVTVTAEQGSDDELRTQTTKFIRRSYPESSNHSSTFEPDIGIRQESSVLADLYHQWDVATDKFLAEQQFAGDAKREQAWGGFVDEAQQVYTSSLSSAGFFRPQLCAAEAVQQHHNEADVPRLVSP
ncbi:MAG: hypothetical protein V3V61_05195 [Gammaproteobacteria bacterium]